MKNQFKTFLIVLAGLSLIACSKGKVSMSSTDSQSQDAVCISSECNQNGPVVIKPVQNMALVNQGQYLKNLTACTGVPSSAATKTTYESFKTGLSTEGSTKDMSAPASMSALVIAGDFCRDILAVEAPQADNVRKFFKGFGVVAANSTTALATLGATAVSDSASRLAKSCLGRDLSSTEQSLIKTDLGGAGLVTTRQAALALCSTLLSSLSAVSY